MTNLDQFLLRGPPNGDLARGLDELRYNILTNGIPANSDGMSELRVYIWLILLNCPPVQTEVYLDLLRQGACPVYSKIRNDTCRTFNGDPLFRRRVTENSLSRVLNAVAWRLNDAHEARVNGWMSPPTLSEIGSPEHTFHSRGSLTATDTTTNGSEADGGSSEVGYVQGMNVLAAVFLYAARSEAEAFVLFENLITKECPAYIRGSMEGVHKGAQLVDQVLEIVDPKLHRYLASKGLRAEIYAFSSVLTMCACSPPLSEVLQLWDFLFAYGAHLSILCVVAQTNLARDAILNNPNPSSLLKHGRWTLPLQAQKTISLAVSFAEKISDNLYQQIVDHAK